MTTLDEGRYWLQSCCGAPPAEFAENPVAEFAVPKGWNAWVGPNRFDVHAAGRSNGEALGHLTWYVGVLILEVDAVNTHGCGVPTPGGCGRRTTSWQHCVKRSPSGSSRARYRIGGSATRRPGSGYASRTR